MSLDENTTNDRAIQDAIRKLNSADDNVRASGRLELLKIGPRAAPAVVNLLWGLIRDRTPGFDEENHDEGTKALYDYKDEAAKALNDYETGALEDLYSLNESEAYETVRRLAINERLFSDAISLLGELKAAEGIPILVRIMERTAGPGGIGPEMKALVKIGSPVVPTMTELIQNARQKAIQAEYSPSVGSGFSILIGADDEDFDDDEEDDEYLLTEDCVDAEDEPAIERRTYRIKQNAIQILAAIGDKSALPFLESLVISERGKTFGIANVASEAVREIKGEPIIGNNPRPIPINWD